MMESNQRPTLNIFFCVAQDCKEWRQRLASLMVLRLTRSPVTHCDVSDGNAVLSVWLDGKRYFPEIPYRSHAPGLIGMVQVPVVCTPDLDAYGPGEPISITATLLKHITRGLIPAPDCVSTTRKVLIDCGVPVPRSITTPIALMRHLMSLGYRLEEPHAR